MEVLWSEKHRPESFAELNFGAEANALLEGLAASAEMPHLVVYGPDGGGKRTRISCLLQRLFGARPRTRREVWSTRVGSSAVELTLRVGAHHTELTPTDVEGADRHVVNKLVKEAASSGALVPGSPRPFLVFVLYDAENMSLGAQAALRRTLEKFASKVRLVFVCESVGRLIPALKSRCLLVRVPAPDEAAVGTAVRAVAERERVDASAALLADIARASGGNLRKALLDLQSFHLTRLSGPKAFVEDWRATVREGIVGRILSTQTPETVKALRAVFYELLINQISADAIIAEMLSAVLCALTSDGERLRAKQIAAEIDAAMRGGDREIVFLESLTVKFMLLIKNKSY